MIAIAINEHKSSPKVDSLSLSNFKLRLENFLELMLCFKEGLILRSPVSDYTRSFDQIAKIYSGP